MPDTTPTESPEQRADARAKAREQAKPGDWLSTILDHHLEIEAAFANVSAATTAETRKAATQKLGLLLTGHAQAEEAVIYPALAIAGDKSHAKTAYDEQAEAKMAMAELEKIEPMSEAYLDKLGHIKAAVQHHVFEEEGTWFPELKKAAPEADQAKLGKRYIEEFDRYMGDDLPVPQTTPRGAGERPSFTG